MPQAEPPGEEGRATDHFRGELLECASRGSLPVEQLAPQVPDLRQRRLAIGLAASRLRRRPRGAAQHLLHGLAHQLDTQLVQAQLQAAHSGKFLALHECLTQDLARIESLVHAVNGAPNERLAVPQLPERRRHAPIEGQFAFVQVDRAQPWYREQRPTQDGRRE